MDKDDVYNAVGMAQSDLMGTQPQNPDMFAIYHALYAIIAILYYALIERGD